MIAECPSRLARSSPNYRLPGWFPCRPTPVHLSLAVPRPMPVLLSVHRLSGHTCAQISACRCLAWSPTGFCNVYVPDDCFPASGWHQHHAEAHQQLRGSIFDAMGRQDSDFPTGAQWFLDKIQLTPIEDHGWSATCTIVFPPLRIDHSRYGWFTDEHGVGPVVLDQRGDGQGWDDEEDSSIIVGQWSDPGTFRVGFYLASSSEQQTSLARCITKLSTSYLCRHDYLCATKSILGSPRFSVVNCLKDLPWNGAEYDTTLWHLLLDKSKHWSDLGFQEIIMALLSRTDLDFSHCGWSWAKRRTVSSAELCFYEWCALASGVKQLWIDAGPPRLYLLAICLFPNPRDSGRRGAVERVVEQVTTLMDKEELFAKKSKKLRKEMLGDLKKLRDPRHAKVLPESFLRADIVIGIQAFLAG